MPRTVRSRRSRLRVLVLDDHRELRESLEEFLRLEGHEVIAGAGDGETGARLISTLKPDLALVDLSLPAIDGWEVARRVRRSLSGRAVRLVAVSGWPEAEGDRRAPFDARLSKPVNLTALRAVIASVGAG